MFYDSKMFKDALLSFTGACARPRVALADLTRLSCRGGWPVQRFPGACSDAASSHAVTGLPSGSAPMHRPTHRPAAGPHARTRTGAHAGTYTGTHAGTNRRSLRLRRRLVGWLLVGLAGCAIQLGAAPRAQAQSANAGVPLERRVKAAFLYKFLAYADFPAGAFADASAPLTIGVVGADELAVELARVVAGRTINGRGIDVRTLREGEPAPRVHLLFVGGSDPQRVAHGMRQVSGAMLIVTECDNGLQLGSAINFRIVDERVRFDVSLDAAERNGIKLSSRLLTVANRVQKGVQ
jgi:hypothetical protein